MVVDSGLEKLCVIGKNWTELVAKVEEYRMLDYSEAYYENRKDFLMKNFSNDHSISMLLDKIDFPSSNKTASRKTDNKVLKGLSQLSLFMSYFSL
jgi:hypothetical protein